MEACKKGGERSSFFTSFLYHFFNQEDENLQPCDDRAPVT